MSLTYYHQLTVLCIIFLCSHLRASPLSDNESGFSVNTDLLAGAVENVAEGQLGVNALNNNFNRSNAPNNSTKSKPNNSDGSDYNITMLDNNICTREETYEEQLKTPSMQPVRVRSSNWCLEFPPRCSNYKTEMRQVMKVENITKTRTIRFCCDGYAGNISINDTVCKPVCRGGCGRGYCQKPDVCSCDAGYTGKHCTQRCDHDHWGEECKNQCRCENGAVCDNKSGLCHCTTGWTGELCELPCPSGTYGVMCRKECDCHANNNACHAQTGDCHANKEPDLLPIVPPNLTHLKPEVNVTHVMIETLNSTIVNITHNLDRIAKNIGNNSPTTTESVTYLLPELDVTTAHTVPEVIVIKQNEPHHTPKIIVHQPSGSTQSKTPEVIHVITNWQQHHLQNASDDTHNLNLAGFAGAGLGVLPTATPANSVVEHDSNLLTTLLIILLMIMIMIALGFLYVYRRYHRQRERVEAAMAERGGGAIVGGCASAARPQGTMSTANMGESKVTLGNSFLKPLPDLPAFTQMVANKIEAPTYYDSPSSNASSIKPPSYAYARKESIYSVISPKSRKCSLDSHLYDEIRYPSAHQQHHHHQHQHQNQHHLNLPQHSQSLQQQHVTHLQVPIPNMNYLQVPKQHTHKINHL